jgi:hypothetical protein
MNVEVVRVYLREGESQLEELLKQLNEFEHVRGVTVFRGIAGFGDSGKIHTSKFIDLSLDLPLVVEFFDVPDKVDAIIEHLHQSVKPGHILRFPAAISEP